MKKSYAELLKDPRWQRKRLEILEYWDFKCSHCGDRSSPLNVHHGAYAKDKDPWDYPNEMLHCLCDHCHEEAHAYLDSLRWRLGLLPLYQLVSLFKIFLGHSNADDRSRVQEAAIAFAMFIGLHDSTSAILDAVTKCWDSVERDDEQ